MNVRIRVEPIILYSQKIDDSYKIGLCLTVIYLQLADGGRDLSPAVVDRGVRGNNHLPDHLHTMSLF